MIAVILACLFIIYYHNYDNPPLHDIISPLITLTIAANLLDKLYIMSYVLMLVSLGLESVADFYMNKDSLKLSIFLFSFGHLFRQLAFLSICPLSPISILISATTAILIIKKISNIPILYYSSIIFLSAVQVSIMQSDISYGYFLFIISDLIIGYEMIIFKIKPRWFRIIIVPLLYWIAQYRLVYEFLQL